jgi:hypothetical protein
MAEEPSPPAGPLFNHGGAPRHGHTLQDPCVPNLCDLVGMLKVTVSAVRNIPLVPAPPAPRAPSTDAAVPPDDSLLAMAAAPPPHKKKEEGAPRRRGPKGIQGSPFLKMQMGLHQFQTMEPTLAALHENAKEGDTPDLEWGETLGFELSGDMRELRVFLMNWDRPFVNGPQGVICIPVGELVNSKWANTTRTLTKFLVTGKDEEPLKYWDEMYTNMELKVLYEPGSSMMFSSSSALVEEDRVLQTGCMMTCGLCRRWVFVTSRPAPSLAKEARKVKSQRTILLWLRDYNLHSALEVHKLEVPRWHFALPSFIFGPEAAFSRPVRDFVKVLLEDRVLKERLKEIKVLNHNRKLNTWAPMYCSSEGIFGGLVEAVSVAVWGIQDMASRLALEVQQDFRESYDRYLHLWSKQHFDWFPNHTEYECKRDWQKIKDELEDGKTFSLETTILRILILAHVLNRPLVIHSDEPIPEVQEGGVRFEVEQALEQAHRIKPFKQAGDAQSQDGGPSHVRGIYLPMLHPKPLLLESNRDKYRPPVALVYSTETQSFSPLAAQEEEESDLFEILPWPPLLPLFAGQV